MIAEILALPRARPEHEAVIKTSDLCHVNDVLHDHRFGRPHHSPNHHNVPSESHRRGIVSIRATMSGIALAGFLLGHLADRFGRKPTIIAVLTLFAAATILFDAGNSFCQHFCALKVMALSGAAIGIFKTAALALIGDIVTSTKEHTSTMNTVEGFFGVGSIIGPAILARLLSRGLGWQWLYVLAVAICVLLIVTAAAVRYPVAAST